MAVTLGNDMLIANILVFAVFDIIFNRKLTEITTFVVVTTNLII